MKNILLFILLTCSYTSFSQTVVDRKRKLTLEVVEKYHTVIEDKKEVKQGLFQAFYKQTLIASGEYTSDKKTGIWHFYNKRGEAIENFNYNTNTLLGEEQEDSTSNFRYAIDGKLNPNDRATKPIKIGGRYYGYVPYLRLFKIPADMAGISPFQFYAVMELLISPGGRLADFKIHLKSSTYERVININPDLLIDEEKQFMPATINGQSATSRIFIQCYLTDADEIDMW